MTPRQVEGVNAWWGELDVVDRARVLRDDVDDELLAEDLAAGLVRHGVIVVPADRSLVDGRPEGWYWPPVLDEFLADLRGEPAPSGPGGRLCRGCGEPVDDGEEWVDMPVLAGLSFAVHVECVRSTFAT